MFFVVKGAGRPSVETWAAGRVSAEDLDRAAQAKVFFGHNSVGMNVLDAVPGLYAAHQASAPHIVELDADGTAALSDGPDGYLAHAYIGRNGDPAGKIRDFDATVRGGVGDRVDVALMKLCYADVSAGSDVDALFELYRTTLAALARDYPGVTFLHVTTPLTTEPGLKSWVKGLLRRDDTSRADNVARERLNELIRKEYGPDRLFDVARVESTEPDGSRVSGSHEGSPYFALYGGYAADPGHLNPGGARAGAAVLLGLVAHTAGR